MPSILHIAEALKATGSYTLIIDNLLSLDIITAGQEIAVYATEKADFFSSIRSAGMNLGVVISATYKVADLTNGGQAQYSNLTFTAAQNESYFNLLESLSGSFLPSFLSSLMLITTPLMEA